MTQTKERQQIKEEDLVAWLARQMSAACPGCGRAYHWMGRWEEMPACPHCGDVPDLVELQEKDAEYAAAALAPRLQPCEKCRKEMTFVRNIDTGKVGPVDMVSAVYVILTPPLIENGERLFNAYTHQRFLDRVARIEMKDGTTVDPRSLLLGVIHYATCPSAAHFSSHGGYRPRNGGRR